MSFKHITDYITPFLNYLAKLKESSQFDESLSSDQIVRPEILDVQDLILSNCQSLPDITKNILESRDEKVLYHNFLADFGSIAEILLGGVRTIISNDPDFASQIFKEKVIIQRLANDDGLAHLGMKKQGIAWNNDNESWKQVRKVFQSSMKEKDLKLARLIAEREVLKLVKEQLNNSSSGCFNFFPIFRKVSLRVTLELFSGITNQDLLNNKVCENEIIESVANYFKALEFFLFRPNSELDHDLFTKHRKAVENLHFYVDKLIACSVNKQKQQNGRSNCEKNFIERLLELNFEPEMLRQCFAEMLLAGTDTSSLTMYYCMLGFSGNDQSSVDFQQNLHRLAGSCDVEFDHLVDQLALETLRFKTVSPLIIRQANSDVTLNIPDLGVTIPINKNDGVIINIESMNHLPGIWKNPNLFIPGRDDFEANKGKFFPFGEGPKSCVGKYLGLSIVRAVLKSLINEYSFEVVGDVSLETLETHWDIANQPNETPLIKCTPRV